MNEPLTWLWAGLAGGGLGMMFYGGLWWTIRRGVSSRQPVFWFAGSLLLRMGLTLAGFYLVGHGRWERLAACLLGFVAARLAVARLTRQPLAGRFGETLEGSHAP